MNIKKLRAGVFHTNTYIVISGGSAAVIDPAGSAERIHREITAAKARLTAILLTHGHYDHTSAVAELTELSGESKPKVYIHKQDAGMLNSQSTSYAALMEEKWNPCSADVFPEDGARIPLNGIDISVMETPGHSAGSVMYVIDGENPVIFSGDTLFEGSVGRTDGFSGSAAVQRESLMKIKAMAGDYRILPGHGGETTLKHEKQRNPFLMEC
jgi:glyoxylase-like metal-dependent hydrolase (beta-lactamase superfamily II)